MRPQRSRQRPMSRSMWSLNPFARSYVATEWRIDAMARRRFLKGSRRCPRRPAPPVKSRNDCIVVSPSCVTRPRLRPCRSLENSPTSLIGYAVLNRLTFMEWSDVRVFLAVAEAGSLSAAARRLKLSQPTAGRRIQALERQLGFRLFDRGKDGLALTASGSELLPAATEMARAAEAMERQRPVLEGSLSGVVRIAAGGWMSRFLGRRADELTEGLPGLRIEIFNAYQF